MKKPYNEILKGLRINNKLTQKKLASKLHKAESTIRMWELGKNKPDFDTLNSLADFYQVSVDFIMGRVEE